MVEFSNHKVKSLHCLGKNDDKEQSIKTELLNDSFNLLILKTSKDEGIEISLFLYKA